MKDTGDGSLLTGKCFLHRVQTLPPLKVGPDCVQSCVPSLQHSDWYKHYAE